MRRLKVLLLTACLITAEMFAANMSAGAQPKAMNLLLEPDAAISGAGLRPVVHNGVALVEQALQDAIRILSKNNSCSGFYGDTMAAKQVLRRLAGQFQIHPLRESTTGIEMSGNITYFYQTEEHVVYRLFAAATINSRGAFFKAKVFPSEPYVPHVGMFFPNTREARVLMLLHELGHLIKGANGSWLIPDDGNSPELSKQNTALIESQCRAQIFTLSQRADGQIVWNHVLWQVIGRDQFHPMKSGSSVSFPPRALDSSKEM